MSMSISHIRRSRAETRPGRVWRRGGEGEEADSFFGEEDERPGCNSGVARGRDGLTVFGIPSW